MKCFRKLKYTNLYRSATPYHYLPKVEVLMHRLSKLKRTQEATLTNLSLVDKGYLRKVLGKATIPIHVGQTFPLYNMRK